MMKWTLEGKLLFVMALVLLFQTLLFLGIDYFQADVLRWFPLILLVSLVLLILTIKLYFAPIKRVTRALDIGVDRLKDNDFSVAIEDKYQNELGLFVKAYNELATVLRDKRMALFQRELLLDTVLQTTPLAMILTNGNGQVIYSNRPARKLVNQQGPLEGKRFSSLAHKLPAELQEATELKKQGLYTVTVNEEKAVFHLSCQTFMLNNQPHSLYLYKNLTAELSREEVMIWKKVIRLISHELNNSLAPIASLTHSAKKILTQPKHLGMLNDIFDTIAQRTEHLHQFIDQYAQFARLPLPNREKVDFPKFLKNLSTFLEFQLQLPVPIEEAFFDTGQIEQVLINLLKNAKESGSLPEEIILYIEQNPSQLCFSILDRGTGMSAQQIQQALLPFYTTKQEGTGLGLPLCNEIIMAHGGKLKIINREGGGVVVQFMIPPKA